MKNIIDLIDDLSPHFRPLILAMDYICQGCHGDEIEIDHVASRDGDMCLVEIIDVALISHGWCPEKGVCDVCIEAAEKEEAQEKRENGRVASWWAV